MAEVREDAIEGIKEGVSVLEVVEFVEKSSFSIQNLSLIIAESNGGKFSNSSYSPCSQEPFNKFFLTSA